MTAPTIRRPAPPARTPARNAPSSVPFVPIPQASGHRVVLYGPGGIGKSTLAARAPGPVAFFDFDESLPRLALEGDIRNVQAATWQELRDALHADGWDEIQTIVIDSATRAEELAVAWVLANVPKDKGEPAKRIEDYGYGKGYRHVYDTMLELLSDLDRHTRAGRNVVLVCHDANETVPNPEGDDWLRYEPRLQHGKASVRLRIREWADHVLFIGYDRDTKGGKGIPLTGTRTLYPTERSHCMAKSRTTEFSIVVELNSDAVWQAVMGKS